MQSQMNHRSPTGPETGGSPVAIRPGFTLVEMLVATLLATLLMGALVGVLRSMDRQREALTADDLRQPWQGRLEERLRWDFQNARQMHASRSQLTLIGYGSHDRSDGMATHEPCEVVYWVQQVGSTTCLLRQERLLQSSSNRAADTEVMALGVASLHVGRAEDELDDLLQRPDGPNVLSPVPSRLRCVVADNDTAPITDFVVVRGGRR